MSVLLLHNRYRTHGGEERAVADQAWLFREEMGLAVELLERYSAGLQPARAAYGLLRGGLDAIDVAGAVRLSSARIVHAHNIHPTFGWRALAAARAAGAKVIWHLHNYRLVCAVGTCVRGGFDCTSCHGRNTLPGVRHGCRGGRGEAVVYGAALAGWQQRLVQHVDAFVVPSEFAVARLRELGVPLPWERVHVIGHFVRRFADGSVADKGEYALVVGRLAVEKGVDVAIKACARAGRRLVVAGDGPERAALERLASALGGEVRFVGRVAEEELWRLRRGAAVELAPSRAPETFGLAALEAQAAGVPVVASDSGALASLVSAEQLTPAGSVDGLTVLLQRYWGDTDRGYSGLERVRATYVPASMVTRYNALHRVVIGVETALSTQI